MCGIQFNEYGNKVIECVRRERLIINQCDKFENILNIQGTLDLFLAITFVALFSHKYISLSS